jgi:hypothetical protein
LKKRELKKRIKVLERRVKLLGDLGVIVEEIDDDLASVIERLALLENPVVQ